MALLVLHNKCIDDVWINTVLIWFGLENKALILFTTNKYI